MEGTPDTDIMLLNGRSHVVTEPDASMVERILGYHGSVHGSGSAPSPGALRVMKGQ